MEIPSETKEGDILLRYVTMCEQYEEIISSFSEAVQFYQNKIQMLKEEINRFMEENRNLAKQVEKLLKHNIDHKAVSENDSFKNAITENLKKQLEITLQEKQTLTDLWQASLKTIDQLEQELKLFEGHTHGYIPKTLLNQEKEKHQKDKLELEMEIKKLNEKLVMTLEVHTKVLKAKNNEIQHILEEHHTTKDLAESLENELKELREKQSEIDSLNEKFTKILSEKNVEIKEFKVKEYEMKLKLNEALILTENAILEKEAAVLRENQAKEDAVRLLQDYENKLEENKLKLSNDLENLEKLYEEKQIKLCEMIRDLKKELEATSSELEKTKRECKILEEEVARIKKGNSYIDETNTSRLLILEKNLESTFQKMLISEKKCIQLTAERDTLKSDMEQMASMYQDDIKLREIEKSSLQSKIINLQKELDLNRKNVLMITENVEKLSTEIEQITIENKKTVMDKELKVQKTLEEMKQLQGKFDKLRKVAEHMHMEHDINKKWQNSMEEMTKSFGDKIKELRKEISRAKKANSKIRNELVKTKMELQKYKKFYDQMSTVNNLLADITEVSIDSHL